MMSIKNNQQKYSAQIFSEGNCRMANKLLFEKCFVKQKGSELFLSSSH